MAYVKRFDHGAITMDLPYFNYFYELPLHSFRDTLGNVSVSLIFNYSLTNDSNVYNLKPGYKLNLHKKLIISSNGAYDFCNEYGKTVSITAQDDISLRFLDDESQRFIYQQGSNYVMEYPDGSKEIYESDGKILSRVDKYGYTVLTYLYDASNKLTGLTYRSEKTVTITYDGLNRISEVSYAQKSVTFEYIEEGIRIHFFTGDIVELKRSGFSFRAMAGELSNNTPTFKKAIEVVGSQATYSATVSEIVYPGAYQTDSIEYSFPDYTSFGSYSSQVEITDLRGSKQRVQFIGKQATYSYEVSGDDVSFIEWNEHAYYPEDMPQTYRYTGNIQLLGKDNGTGATQTIGRQLFRDGDSMLPSNSNQKIWESRLNGSYKDFILSGWAKVINDANRSDVITVNVAGSTVNIASSPYTFAVYCDPHNQWIYFSTYVTFTQAEEKVYIYSSSQRSTVQLKDLRITIAEKVISGNEAEGDAHSLTSCDGLILHENGQNTFIPMSDVDFKTADSDTALVSTFDTVWFDDVLRNKINYKKGVHTTEFLCGKISNAAFKTANREVTVIYSGREIPFSSFYPAKRQYVKKHGYIKTYVVDDDTNEFLILRTVDEDDNVLSSQTVNAFSDVISSTKDNLTQAIVRDTFGRITSESVSDSDGKVLFSQGIAYGVESGNPTITLTDEFQHDTVTTMDATWGNVISTEFPNGTVSTNEYDDSMSFVTRKIFGENNGRSIELGYPNAFSTTLQTGDLDYSFDYQVLNVADSNEVMRMTERTTVTNQSASLTVYDANPYMEKSYYPSVTSPSYSVTVNLDKYGRVSSVSGMLENEYDIIPIFDATTGERTAHADNANAILAASTDIFTNKKARYEYDVRNRLVKKTVTGNDLYSSKASDEEFVYDNMGRLTSHTIGIYNGTVLKSTREDIAYVTPDDAANADGRISEYSYFVEGNQVVKSVNTYDVLKRISQKAVTLNAKSISKVFAYDKTRLSEYNDAFGQTSLGEYHLTYDQLGRISGQERRIAGSVHTFTYVYDIYGQLIRENNPDLNKSFVYSYDSIGNITSVKEYPYTLGTLPANASSTKSFVYDTARKDRLTSYNGSTITYNSSGCVSSYKGESYSWKNGLLSTITKGLPKPNSASYQSCSFTYNSYGQRTKKHYQYRSDSIAFEQANPTYITTYSYDHLGRLVRETCLVTYLGNTTTHTHSLVYLYDEMSVVGLMYGYDTSALQTYYYHRNPQGDVVSIHDTNGNKVVEYAYDAYGNCTVVHSTNPGLSDYNPIRYRGYYYDRETGLYYLNARYYNPEWRRFISSDEPSYLDPTTVNGLNLYVYCGNDPVNYADPSGHFMLSTAVLIGAIIGGVVGLGVGFGIVAYNDYKDDGQIFNGSVAWYDYLGATLLGGIIGIVAGGTIGYGVGYLAGGTYSNGLVAKSVTKGVKSFMSNTNNINHVLGKAQHNLSGYTAKSMGKLMKKTLAKGTYEVYKTVNSMVLASTNSQVTYVIINGIIKIGDMWIR